MVDPPLCCIYPCTCWILISLLSFGSRITVTPLFIIIKPLMHWVSSWLCLTTIRIRVHKYGWSRHVSLPFARSVRSLMVCFKRCATLAGKTMEEVWGTFLLVCRSLPSFASIVYLWWHPFHQHLYFNPCIICYSHIQLGVLCLRNSIPPHPSMYYRHHYLQNT